MQEELCLLPLNFSLTMTAASAAIAAVFWLIVAWVLFWTSLWRKISQRWVADQDCNAPDYGLTFDGIPVVGSKPQERDWRYGASLDGSKTHT
jgi:hypothetical protein